MMGKFKVGQRVKCVWVGKYYGFSIGNEYEILGLNDTDNSIVLNDDTNAEWSVKAENSFIAKFEPVTPKFTAVSGDQSLFDLVGASDNELYIVKASTTNAIYADYLKAGNVIAERKPYVEKYVPKVGDVFTVEQYAGGVYKCLFIDNDGVIHCSRNGHLASLSPFDRLTFVKVGK